jgi:hypothetical protein
MVSLITAAQSTANEHYRNNICSANRSDYARKAPEDLRRLGGAEYIQMLWYGFGGGFGSRIGCIVSYCIANVAILSHKTDFGVVQDSRDVSGVVDTIIANV